MQGATLARVTLDFNFKYFVQCKFSAVYVGLTRVRSTEHLRLLPSQSATVDTWVAGLTWSPDLRQWMEAALGERAKQKAATERRKARVAAWKAASAAQAAGWAAQWAGAGAGGAGGWG